MFDAPPEVSLNLGCFRVKGGDSGVLSERLPGVRRSTRPLVSTKARDPRRGAGEPRTEIDVAPWCENRDVSDEIGELRVVEDAFDRPTLRLLHGKFAAVRVAVLRALFDSERRSIPTDLLHVRVGR